MRIRESFLLCVGRMMLAVGDCFLGEICMWYVASTSSLALHSPCAFKVSMVLGNCNAEKDQCSSVALSLDRNKAGNGILNT